MRGGSVSRTICALALALLLPATALALDPTQPPPALAPAAAHGQPAVAALRLQAIVRTPQAVRAVINGESLRVGEWVAGARLVAIHSRSVVIDRQGQRDVLHLMPPLLTPSRTTP